MNRQVDIKALVSHIVRGDGADKCRICLGDTSEGQVYLGDTVMKDGDKAVTLAELLQTITGVQVLLEDELPSGLCPTCSHSAINAAAFRSLCKESVEGWDTTVQLLETLPDRNQFNEKKSSSIYVVLSENLLTVIDGSIDYDDEDQIGDDFQSDFLSVSAKEPIIKRRRRYRNLECGCPDCGKQFKRPQLLCKHFMDSSDNRRCCHFCATIMSRDKLVVHLRDVHKSELVDCKKCPALFQSENQLQQHLETAHVPGAYSCCECGRNFKSSNAFHGHMTAHCAKNCPKCDKLFRNHPCYMHHVRICCNLDKSDRSHRKKNKVLVEIENKNNKKVKVGVRGAADSECICDYCGKTFAGKRFVCAHIQIVHMKNTHRPCPYCGKSFAAAHMTVHINRHKQATKITCEHCGIVLRSKLGYVQHIRLHTGEKPYKCEHCSETFLSSSRRSEHMRKTHSTGPVKRHACHLCPARFRQMVKLKKHLYEAHTPKSDRPIVGFECPECHIKFGSVRGLLHHTKTHQELQTVNLKKHDSVAHSSKSDKPVKGFECAECHMKFDSDRALLHHAKTHQKFSLKTKNKLSIVKTSY